MKKDDETVGDWLRRVSVVDSGWLRKARWRRDNEYWLKDGFNICLSILSFLEYSDMIVEDLEELCGFEIDLHGKYDWKLSEIKKLEQILDKKLL